MARRWVLGLILAGIAGNCWGGERDAGAKVPSFVAFRKKLVSALKRKDGQLVLSVTAADINWSFGDSPGRAGFAKAYGLPGKGSPFYKEMLGILSRGSERVDSRIIQAPAGAETGKRAGFERRKGKWTLIYYVAGD